MSTGNVILSEPARIKGRHIRLLGRSVDTMLILSTGSFLRELPVLFGNSQLPNDLTKLGHE
jgi:hypothetical protein